MQQGPVRVAILALPQAGASIIYGMYDLFVATGQEWGVITRGDPGPKMIEPILISRDGGPVTTANGVTIQTQTSLDECPPVAAACVPEVNVMPGTLLRPDLGPEMDWLAMRYRNGTMLSAACSGAMLFAEAGLLEGQDATTHWAWCGYLQERFPTVRVHPQRALVSAGEGQRLVMAGGGTTWLDLTVYLVSRLVGVEHAMQLARVNLIDWHQAGPQPFASLVQARQVDDAVIARCQQWIAGHYEIAHPVTEMVRLSGLAERTFKRRFRAATGLAPLEYVQALRLEEAKQMLEAGDDPVEAVAQDVGYADTSHFNRLFKRKVGLTPAQYRRRFGGFRQQLAAPA